MVFTIELNWFGFRFILLNPWDRAELFYAALEGSFCKFWSLFLTHVNFEKEITLSLQVLSDLFKV